MKWWKLHGEWLTRQSHELRSTSTYAESAQIRENLLVSAGEVVVRQQTAQRFPILVVFPDATPYEPPKVFLLKKPPDQKELVEIAGASFGGVAKIVASNIKFYHHRHQGADGSLCIVEGDHLYAEQPDIFSIHSILERVRDWFASLLNGHFPPDSAEVELYYHFPSQAEDMEILVTSPFLNTSVVEGVFCASAHKALQIADRKTYVGLVVVGQDEAGVSHPPEMADNPQNALFADAPDIAAYLSDGGARAQALSDKFLWGSWVDIPREIVPFSSADELAEQVGAGDREHGYATIIRVLKSGLTDCKTRLFLGLRFSGRKEQREWQVFRLTRGAGRPAIINPSSDDLIAEFRGYKIEAVRTTEFTDAAYHMRNAGRADRGCLKEERLTILGCGALGSEIADTMTKAGVGRMLFVDPDMLRPNNLVRHVLGMDRIGQPKALGMFLHATLQNPFVESDPRMLNVLHHETGAYFLDYSTGVCSIADDNVEAFVNEQAVIAGRTVFYVRALRGGKCARIFRVIPGIDACKCCLSMYHQMGDELFPVVPPDESLPTITNECNNPIRPASAADLKIIAALASRIVLDYLHSPASKENHWIWSTEDTPELRQTCGKYGVSASRMPPHGDCPLCGGNESPEVLFDEGVLEEMRREAQSSGKLETGGVLAGFRMRDQRFVVRAASGPGPNAVRKPGEFRRDVEYCQAFLNDLNRQFGGKGAYQGEWHYHPINTNQPSSRDLASLSAIAAQDEYLTECPVMVIFDRDGRASCTVHPFNRIFSKAVLDTQPTEAINTLATAIQ